MEVDILTVPALWILVINTLHQIFYLWALKKIELIGVKNINLNLVNRHEHGQCHRSNQVQRQQHSYGFVLLLSLFIGIYLVSLILHITILAEKLEYPNLIQGIKTALDEEDC